MKEIIYLIFVFATCLAPVFFLVLGLYFHCVWAIYGVAAGFCAMPVALIFAEAGFKSDK